MYKNFTNDFKETDIFLLEALDQIESYGYKLGKNFTLDDIDDILDYTEELKLKPNELLIKTNSLDSIARAIQLREISKL